MFEVLTYKMLNSRKVISCSIKEKTVSWSFYTIGKKCLSVN